MTFEEKLAAIQAKRAARAARVEKQRLRLEEIDERIHRLLTLRADEQDKLGDLIRAMGTVTK
jgi:hypothetical protein